MLNALILAAGFNTRLKSYLKNKPKGLLTIGKKPIIQYILDDLLITQKVYKIALICNQQTLPYYRAFLNNDKYSKVILINNKIKQETDRLGAIGDLDIALKELNWHDDLVVLTSDTLISSPLSEIVDFFYKHYGFVSVVRQTNNLKEIANRLGCATLKQDRIIGFEEKPAKPKSHYLSVPLYIYPKESLKLIKSYIQEKHKLDSPGMIISYLIDKIKCYAYIIKNGFSYDIGTIDVYKKLSKNPAKYLSIGDTN